MSIEDEYTAYCFDEACAYIYSEMHQYDKKGNLIKVTPKWPRKTENEDMHYKSFSDMYRDIDLDNSVR